MAYMPMLEENRTSRDITDTFRGYNHNLKIGAGEFFDTKNLTSTYYPLLASRKKRGMVKKFSDYQGITALNNKLAYVDAGKLYYGGEETMLHGITPGMKQFMAN